MAERCRQRLGDRGVDVSLVGFDARTRGPTGCTGCASTTAPASGTTSTSSTWPPPSASTGSTSPASTSWSRPSHRATWCGHPRVVALTYHQARVFYDLADEFTAAGGYVRPAVHAAAVEQVRALDRSRIGSGGSAPGSPVPTRWPAGWQRWWDVEGTTPFRAYGRDRSGRRPRAATTPPGRRCASAATSGPSAPSSPPRPAAVGATGSWELVGGGSRLAWVRHLLEALDRRPVARLPRRTRGRTPGATGDRGPLSRRTSCRPPTAPASTPADHVRLHGEVDDAARDDAYRRAGVVVAPTFREDYGLTVLEAFAHGRPVVVCDDGGGLVELVEGTGGGPGRAARPRCPRRHGRRPARFEPARARDMAGPPRPRGVAHRRAAAVDDLDPPRQDHDPGCRPEGEFSTVPPVKLIIQIPCLNEEDQLPGTIADLPGTSRASTTVECLVVDDGSTDRTVEVARELGVHHIVRLTNNKGLARRSRPAWMPA